MAMLLGKPSPDIRLAAPGRAGGQAELNPTMATCFYKQERPFRKLELLIPVCFDSDGPV